MTNPEQAISNLEKRICCILSGDQLITGAEYHVVKRKYKRIVEEVQYISFYRDKLKKLTELFERFRCLYCYAEPPAKEIYMINFLDTPIITYPVGVFNVDDDFLGIANNAIEYAAIWNSDLANQVHGTLLPGFDPFTFFLPAETVLENVTGLRYYEYTGPANLQLFVGPNDIIHYGSTLLKGSVDGTAITTTTRKEWNRALFANGLKSTIPADTVYTVNCTGYVDSASLKVFHNEDSEYAAVSHSNGFYTISGYYPIFLKAVYYAGRMATNYNNILNWDQLPAFFSWYSFSVGGTVWGMSPENFPLTLVRNNITQLGLGEDTDGPPAMTNYSYIDANRYPNLEDLAIAWNTGDALTGSELWFLTMPKVTNLFIYRTQTVTQVAASVADAVWNNIGTALTGVTPTGAVKELRVQRTNNITAASLAARTALAGAGWTILTN